jgi:hypothetical protein
MKARSAVRRAIDAPLADGSFSIARFSGCPKGGEPTRSHDFANQLFLIRLSAEPARLGASAKT